MTFDQCFLELNISQENKTFQLTQNIVRLYLLNLFKVIKKERELEKILNLLLFNEVDCYNLRLQNLDKCMH